MYISFLLNEVYSPLITLEQNITKASENITNPDKNEKITDENIFTKEKENKIKDKNETIINKNIINSPKKKDVVIKNEKEIIYKN